MFSRVRERGTRGLEVDLVLEPFQELHVLDRDDRGDRTPAPHDADALVAVGGAIDELGKRLARLADAHVAAGVLVARFVHLVQNVLLPGAEVKAEPLAEDLAAALDLAGVRRVYPGDQSYFADSSLPSYDADATALLTRGVLDFLDRV